MAAALSDLTAVLSIETLTFFIAIYPIKTGAAGKLGLKLYDAIFGAGHAPTAQLISPASRNSRKPRRLSRFSRAEIFIFLLPFHLKSDSASFSANRAQRPASVPNGAPVMAVNPLDWRWDWQ